MNINKFTQKSIEAVNQCEKIAYDYKTIDLSMIENVIPKL